MERKRIFEETWEEAGEKGFKNFTQAKFYQSSYKEAGKLFISQPGSVILDAGCGSGGLFPYILDEIRPDKVVAVDFSQSLLREAKRVAAELTNSEVFYFPGKVDLTESFPWSDNTFDAEIFNIVIEHLPPGEWTKTIREAWRTLKPGGYIYINTHTRGWEKEGIGLPTILRFLEELVSSPLNALMALKFHMTVFLPKVRRLAKEGMVTAPEPQQTANFLQKIGFEDVFVTGGSLEYDVERIRARKPS